MLTCVREELAEKMRKRLEKISMEKLQFCFRNNRKTLGEFLPHRKGWGRGGDL